LKSRSILILGFIVSIVYIAAIVYYQASYPIMLHSKVARFLLEKNDSQLKVKSLLGKNDTNDSLLLGLDGLCRKYKCQRDIDFNLKDSDKSFRKLIEKFILFIDDNNVSKATIIANGKNIDIDFLVKNKDDLNNLKELYKNDFYNFNINDNSSVIKVLDIKNIENSINDILKKQKIVIDSGNINLKIKKILDQIFIKLKVLGNISVKFYLNDLNKNKIDTLKNFIKENYPWIKNIEIIKGKNKKIKIKEVLI